MNRWVSKVTDGWMSFASPQPVIWTELGRALHRLSLTHRYGRDAHGSCAAVVTTTTVADFGGTKDGCEFPELSVHFRGEGNVMLGRGIELTQRKGTYWVRVVVCYCLLLICSSILPCYHLVPPLLDVVHRHAAVLTSA